MKKLWDRIIDLVSKNIGVKGEIFWIATVLMLSGKLDATTWLICAGVFAGVRTIEKMIYAKKGLGNVVS